MTGALAAAYQSGAQRARVVTESWGEIESLLPQFSSPKTDMAGAGTSGQ